VTHIKQQKLISTNNILLTSQFCSQQQH